MIHFEERVPLNRLSNYKIGGEARWFFEPKTTEELQAGMLKAKKECLPVFVLGGGTNVLFHDTGFNGLVIKLAIHHVVRNKNDIRAGAGVMMSNFLDYAADHSLSGLEWAGGLPGTLGGAVRGNAGAFGGEIKDTIAEVASLNPRTMQIVIRTKDECDFAYRSSIFKGQKEKEIILEAAFHLQKGDAHSIHEAIDEKIRYRALRHPLEYPNIGSIFKNVPVAQFSGRNYQLVAHKIKTDPMPVVPAAYLIAEAGLKGISFGGAMISPKHANFIVNVCDAKARDVQALIQLAKSSVYKKFKVHLEEEIEFLK